MKINPEKKEDLKLDVKGYGCWADCNVHYYNQKSDQSCGDDKTAHDSIFY